MHRLIDTQQVVGFITFTLVVITVLLGGFCFALHRIWQIWKNRKDLKSLKPMSLPAMFFIGGAIIGLLCIGYATWIEPYRLTTTHLTIHTSKWDKGEHVRLVHISDLHCDTTVRLERKLAPAIAAEQPDLICFTGDATNEFAALQNFKLVMGQIASIAPTFCVRGNHDMNSMEHVDVFAGTRSIELTNQVFPLSVRGEGLWIGGRPFGSKVSVSEIMKNAPPRALHIFLEHMPDDIEEMRDNDIDLYLAGHTHGGQIALPFYGAIITLAATGKRYEAGHYALGDTHLYVNRGIGMESGHAPRVRFCAPPEITVIDIVGTKMANWF